MKKSNKMLLSGLIALLLCLSAATAFAAPKDRLEAIKEAGKLVVATSPDYAPYEFLDKDGNPIGADISFAQYIADQLGVELVIDPMDFDTVLAAVVTGKADLALAGMVPKDERKETMDFSDVYYNDGYQGIIIHKKNADTLKLLTDFDGKTVAAQNGTLQQELVTGQLPGVKMETIVKIPDGIMMVMTGKVDGLALASVVAEEYLNNYEDLMLCETLFDYTSLGVAIAVPKPPADAPDYNTAYMEALNAIVKDVVDNGHYMQWMAEAKDLVAEMNK